MSLQFLTQPLPQLVSNLLALLGTIGSLATVVALGIGIWQLKKVESAAQSAANAADRAADELRKNYRQFVAGLAQRNLTEVKLYVKSEQWDLVMTRVADLGDQAAQMVQVTSGNERWRQACKDLRSWEHTFKRIASEEIKFSASVSKKWGEFILLLAANIDDTFGPFHEQITT